MFMVFIVFDSIIDFTQFVTAGAYDFSCLPSFPIISAVKVDGISIEDTVSEFCQHSQISIAQFEDHIRLLEVTLFRLTCFLCVKCVCVLTPLLRMRQDGFKRILLRKLGR